MKDISHTKKVLLITIALTLASSLIYGFLFLAVKSKNEKISAFLNEADADLKKDETLRSIKITLEDYEEEVAKLDTYFISHEGTSEFIESLESLGEKAGVALTIASVALEQDTRVKNDFKEVLRIRMETSGSWANTFTFLSIIENMPMSVRVENAAVLLFTASDDLSFNGGDRVRSEGEYWKGSFEITAAKLK
jgi:hypothetical protein